VLVRWNPLDLGRIYVKGPVGPYMMIPLRDVTRPHITQFERTLTRKSLKARGLNRPDESLIFDALTAQRQIIENATELTKSQRKLRERLAQAARTTLPEGRAVEVTPDPTP
jgi:putative transposase